MVGFLMCAAFAAFGLPVVLASTTASATYASSPSVSATTIKSDSVVACSLIPATTSSSISSLASSPVSATENSTTASTTSVYTFASAADAVTLATASSTDISTYLSAHNTVRALHGASDLTWNSTLATLAQSWADDCVFAHSAGVLGAFGENLAAGTGSSYTITKAIATWTNEVSEYVSSAPVASHFTQVVWKASTQVGCAVQSCSGIFSAKYGAASFYVCEYYPQGNVIGAFAKNVQV